MWAGRNRAVNQGGTTDVGPQRLPPRVGCVARVNDGREKMAESEKQLTTNEPDSG
jgi:hypothetical protein